MARRWAVGFVTSITLLVTPTASHAWTYVTTRVTGLYPNSNKFQFFAEHASPIGDCEDGKRYGFDPGAPDYPVMVALLSSAFFTNRDVVLAYDETQPRACAVIVDRFEVH